MGIEYTASYVIMFDIVGFSERPGTEQARCADDFLKLLQTNLHILREQDFNIFSTGDGAIICIYEKKPSDRYIIAEIPLSFSRAILRSNKDSDFNLRISINYSPMERIIDVGHFEAIDTKHIQIGNGINIAERIIHFCEPNEIIVSENYWDILFDLNVYRGRFVAHKKVFVKHTRDIEIFSYRPAEDERDFIYDLIHEGRRHLKKYAYFPPIEGSTFQRIKDIGLDRDLRQLCAYTYDTLVWINLKQIFISWGTIYETLKKVPTEQEDEVLVLSRDDLRHDFWSTQSAKTYLTHLELEKEHRHYKHFRIFVRDPHLKLSLPEEVIERLVRLHKPGTLKKIDREYITDNVLLKYLFGVTIFPNLRCAVAPLPVPTSYDEYVETIQYTKVEDMFYRYRDQNFAKTTFKALVIANVDIVNDLVTAFSSLKEHKMLEDV